MKRLVRKAKVSEERKLIRELRDKGEEGGKEWYKFLRGEEDRKTGNVEQLMVNGNIVREKEEMVKAVENLWKDVAGLNEPGTSTIGRKMEEEMDEEIMMDEIERYVKKFKNDKVPGMDGIPNEFYREGGQGAVKGIHELFKHIWREEGVFETWNESRVTLIHKGGNKSKREIKNHRPIAVCDTVCKIFCGILNDKLCEVVERNEVMSEEQNGFRKKQKR